jgi:hypothetical protein
MCCTIVIITKIQKCVTRLLRWCVELPGIYQRLHLIRELACYNISKIASDTWTRLLQYIEDCSWHVNSLATIYRRLHLTRELTCYNISKIASDTWTHLLQFVVLTSRKIAQTDTRTKYNYGKPATKVTARKITQVHMLLQTFHESEHNVGAKFQILLACLWNGGELTCTFIRVC